VKTLKATLALYRAAIQDGARAYGRGIIGAFGLLLGSAFLLLVSTVLGPLIAPFGGAGSLLFGLFFSALMAYVIGAYLACVEAALDARKMLPPSVLKDAIGHYFGECIGTMFWMWIGGLLLGFVLDGWVGMAAWRCRSSWPCSSTRSPSSSTTAGPRRRASSRRAHAGSGRTGPSGSLPR
jgi:hypothetical protein